MDRSRPVVRDGFPWQMVAPGTLVKRLQSAIHPRKRIAVRVGSSAWCTQPLCGHQPTRGLAPVRAGPLIAVHEPGRPSADRTRCISQLPVTTALIRGCSARLSELTHESNDRHRKAHYRQADLRTQRWSTSSEASPHRNSPAPPIHRVRQPCVTGSCEPTRFEGQFRGLLEGEPSIDAVRVERAAPLGHRLPHPRRVDGTT